MSIAVRPARYDLANCAAGLKGSPHLSPLLSAADFSPHGMSKLVRMDAEQLSTRLRISLTSECNFACFFCHNEGQTGRPQKGSAIDIEGYVAIVRAALTAGIREIKLTGGEPLLYRSGQRGIVELTAAISALRAEFDFGLSMTTNGALLAKYAIGLYEAGLDRVTLSIHSLSQAGFTAFIAKAPSSRFISPTHALQAVADAGFKNTKINTVLFGDSDAGSLAEVADIFALASQFQVAEHRLYTVVDGSRLGVSAHWIRHWNDGLGEEVARSIFDDSSLRSRFLEALAGFVGRPTDSLDRESLCFTAGQTTIVIDDMRSERFAALGISDEGAYAIRLGADGTIRAFLDRSMPFEHSIATEDGLPSQRELVDEFAVARGTFTHVAARA